MNTTKQILLDALQNTINDWIELRESHLKQKCIHEQTVELLKQNIEKLNELLGKIKEDK